MDPQFRVLAAFAEVPGMVPNTYMVAHSCVELQLWGFRCGHTGNSHIHRKHLYNLCATLKLMVNCVPVITCGLADTQSQDNFILHDVMFQVA